jgi:hypothetical protein
MVARTLLAMAWISDFTVSLFRSAASENTPL